MFDPIFQVCNIVYSSKLCAVQCNWTANGFWHLPFKYFRTAEINICLFRILMNVLLNLPLGSRNVFVLWDHFWPKWLFLIGLSYHLLGSILHMITMLLFHVEREKTSLPLTMIVSSAEYMCHTLNQVTLVLHLLRLVVGEVHLFLRIFEITSQFMPPESWLFCFI